MLNIGCHLSSSKGFSAMGKTALQISANTFQYFSRNPRGSKVKALDLDDISAYHGVLSGSSGITGLSNPSVRINRPVCS